MRAGMELGLSEISVFLRLSAILFLVLTACLVGLDAQSKRIFYTERKATFKDLDALMVLVYVESAAACYNLLHLCKRSISTWFEGYSKWSLCVSWVILLVDQVAAYITFGANLAALQSAVFAVTGEKDFQWMKLCNRYSRFCIQIGGGLLGGFVASLLMALLSSISAFDLFRHYSPKRFLFLKSA
ncbi:hypothetical protein F2P56_017840 [Juglans regia]|uniref:CASP-like protein n=2 Tax=Juglans regia TaxID=51240 RepID=A0A833X699_JUGRE|nr:CASP-like protein XL3 [Juglans regia]KAF5461767.1 hypothetical protein F2P56_017840 [Juglans regia]